MSGRILDMQTRIYNLLNAWFPEPAAGGEPVGNILDTETAIYELLSARFEQMPGDIADAVMTYLEENPTALDQAAVEAILDGRLDEIEDGLSGLKSAIDDVYDGKSVSTIGINKLNQAEVETGKKLNQYGATTDDNGFTVTGFIPIDTTKSSVVFSGMNAAGTQRVGLPTSRICFYDATKTFVSKADSIPSNTVTAIPTNAAYARIDNTNVYWERSPMVEFVDSISEISAAYIEYEETTVSTHGINYLDEKQQEIDTRLSAVEEELTVLPDLSSQVSSNTSRLDDITGTSKPISDLATFEHGYINSAGNYVSTYQYRIATPDYVNIDSDINLVIADGFRVYLAYYDANNAVISVGWVTGALTIEAGSKIRMTIARVTEDSSETADIAVFCSKVTYSIKESVSYLAAKVRDIDAQIPYGCTWDWWISANSIDKFGNAYIGYVDTDAYAGVIRRQPDGVMQYKRLEKSWNDDDHNGMATIVLDDGRILVIGSHAHAQDNHIICYRSTEPYSIDSMEKLSFDIPETGDYKYCTTYSQIFKYNGKLFDFMRVSVQQSGATITNGTGYLCLISDDGGDTWTVYKAIQSSDPYISFAVASDDAKIIKGVYTNNPGTRPVNMMKGFTFDMSTYEFANLSGTKIGELVLLDGGVIEDEDVAHYDDMTDLVQRGETSRSCRLFHVCKTTKANTAFLYAIADDSTNADWVYKLYLNGTSIDVGRSGVPFGSNTYISGACFGKDANTIYYAKATTASADGNHELHKVKISNGAVASDEIVTESSMCMIRPLFLGNGELATVVGHYNDQNSDGTYNGSYTAWELKPMFTHA